MMVKCFHTCRGNETKGGHYHCPVCSTTLLKRTAFTKHLHSHAARQVGASSSALQLVFGVIQALQLSILQALLSSTFLQTLPELVTPLKGHSSCRNFVNIKIVIFLATINVITALHDGMVLLVELGTSFIDLGYIFRSQQCHTD